MREKRHKLPEKKQHTYSMLRFCVFFGSVAFCFQSEKKHYKEKSNACSVFYSSLLT